MNKKQRTKKLRMAALLLAALLLVEGMLPAVEIKAAQEPTFNELVITDVGEEVGYEISNFPSKGKIKNLKISNKKIAKVSASYSGFTGISVKPEKVGMAKLSFDLVYGKKKKHFTSFLVVCKHVNPCKSFKIGKSEIASRFKKQSYCTVDVFKNKKSIKEKISVKAQKGWFLYKLTIDNYESGKVSTKTIKNNSNMTLKNGDNIRADFVNAETGQMKQVSVGLYDIRY